MDAAASPCRVLRGSETLPHRGHVPCVDKLGAGLQPFSYTTLREISGLKVATESVEPMAMAIPQRLRHQAWTRTLTRIPRGRAWFLPAFPLVVLAAACAPSPSAAPPTPPASHTSPQTLPPASGTPGILVLSAPTSVSVVAGGSTTATVSTAVTGGPTQPVTLSVSGLPAGVSASWNPASLDAGGSSTLTFNASSSAAAAAATVTITGTTSSNTHTTTTLALTVQSGVLSVQVFGNHLVDGHGNVVRLLGVDRPGMDVLNSNGSCVDFNVAGPPNEIDAMASWHVNAVRIPLNEDCWLGINGATSATAGPVYQAALHAYVTALHQHGMYAILDLHDSAPGTVPSTGSQAMPDADHAPVFWSSVASSFKNDPGVVFDLFNEPHLSDVLPAGLDYWACWQSGCTVPTLYSNGQAISFPYQAAGMQQLVNAVRSTGATQPIMLEGLNYAENLTPVPSNPSAGWLTYTPTDNAHQLIASVHVYNEAAGSANLTCWNQQYAPVAASVSCRDRRIWGKRLRPRVHGPVHAIRRCERHLLSRMELEHPDELWISSQYGLDRQLELDSQPNRNRPPNSPHRTGSRGFLTARPSPTSAANGIMTNR